MSTNVKTNFLGIPIDGDIQAPNKGVPQRPLSDLEPALRAVIDDDGIVSFGWRQYTPYFNDGDPCVFGVGEPWFRTPAEADADPDDEEEDLSLSTHPSLGPRRWDRGARDFVRVERDADTVARYQRCSDLAKLIESGAFDDVLLEAFGDHADVTITRTGITVDEYEHR